MPKTTIIVPTYNEAENIPELVRRIRASADGIRILVMDDSPDHRTLEAACRLGCSVIHRPKHKGLSKAVLSGIRHSAKADKVIVMDADLQHPPEVLPEMIKALDRHDLVIASRFCDGGSIQGWTLCRKAISVVANLLALPVANNVKDRTSGFFGFRQGVINPDTINPTGWKIGLEAIAKGNYRSVTEVPYTFVPRAKGESKLSKKQVVEYIKQLIPLYLRKWRWIKFGLVGITGVGVYMPILYCLTEFTPLWYFPSAVIGIVCASTSNYFLNHLWTFRERRAGHSHIRGWIKYQMMSGITDGMYLGLLALLVEIFGLWYMLAATIAMVAIFIVKFKVASKWIWNKQKAQV